MRPLLAVVSACLLSACATAQGGVAGEDGVVYGADAETNLKRGDEALDARNFPEARHYFEFVKTKYPFLDAAKTAELRLADTDFEAERFLEARDRYQTFVRLHPTHAQVDYAAFRAAYTHFKDVPSDFFLLPPQEEKDQVEVRNAVIALGDFVRGYPESKHRAEAEQVLLQARRKLAEHELYVARFYAKRERWPAVVARLSLVAKSYPDTGFDEEVAFGLHQAHTELKQPELARAALLAFVQKAPGGRAEAKARALLGELAAVTPTGPADAGR